MFRYIGVICIFLFAFYAIFSYERYQKMRLLQGEGFLLLLAFFANELQGCGRSPAACIHSFQNEAVQKTAFLRAVEKGTPLSEAYASVREGLCLPKDLDEILAGTFSAFGRGGRKEECSRLSGQLSRAEAVVGAERQEQARRLKLCRTLVTASAIGLVILLL